MDDTLLEIRRCWSSSGMGGIGTGVAIASALRCSLSLLEFNSAACLVQLGKVPRNWLLGPAQTLHVRQANYRRSFCCALALHALDDHGGHGVTTFETAACQLLWLVIVLGRGIEPLSVLDRNHSACGRSCRECWRLVHGER